MLTDPTDGAESLAAGDVDGDGDVDLVLAASRFPAVVWLENTGAASFARPSLVTTIAVVPTDLHLADLDGDGDLDVLVASSADDKVTWYENTDGAGAFGPQRIVTTAADSAGGVFAADLDDDGDLDVLSASEFDAMVAWYENVDGLGSFGTRVALDTAAFGASEVRAADVDGDGDQDVVAATASDVRLYVNLGTQGAFAQASIVSDAIAGADDLVLADLDGDMDLDLLAPLLPDQVAWCVNDGGVFGPPLVITDQAELPSAVFAADVDGDGDLDVLSASRGDDAVAWYENEDGAATFGPQQVLTTSSDGPAAVLAADLDGDLDLDVVATSTLDNDLFWIENTGAASFAAATTLVQHAAGAEQVLAADVDGDGDVDVLSASSLDGKIAWYENLSGAGDFSDERIVAITASGLCCIATGDLDGDGSLDVIAATASDDTVAWYPNLGGGAFGPRALIDERVDAASSVLIADVDGDGDADVLATGAELDRVLWFENTDGMGTFGPARTVSNEVDSPRSVAVADLDGDGDLDALSASRDDDKVAWYANANGAGPFEGQRLLPATLDGPILVTVADLNGDGNPDAIASSELDDRLVWYPNADGTGIFDTELLADDQLDTPKAVVTDLDGDGTLDLLVTSRNEDVVAYQANPTGTGELEPLVTVTRGADGPTWAVAADVDGDGDQDVLSSSYGDARIAWYEQVPFAARAVPYNGCGGNPAGSLEVFAGVPRLGEALVLGIHNPLGTQPPGSMPLLAFAFAPDPAFPCGTLVPGLGMAPGVPGEILISLAPPTPIVPILAGPPWIGGTSPAPMTIEIPDDAALFGVVLYAQGAMYDPTLALGLEVGLTSAVGFLVGD